MARKRNPRVESLVRSALADLIDTEINDPRVRLVTITAVEVTPDHDVVTAYYAALDPTVVSGSRHGGDRVPDPDQVAAGLASASGRLRALLVQRVAMRTVPELRFRPDPSSTTSARVESLLRELRTGQDD
jgi:ribosome-binding factor A